MAHSVSKNNTRHYQIIAKQSKRLQKFAYGNSKVATITSAGVWCYIPDTEAAIRSITALYLAHHPKGTKQQRRTIINAIRDSRIALQKP